VTLKWCPVVRREYAALDSSEDATPYSEIIVEGSTLNDPTRARKLLKMLSTGVCDAAANHLWSTEPHHSTILHIKSTPAGNS